MSAVPAYAWRLCVAVALLLLLRQCGLAHADARGRAAAHTHHWRATRPAAARSLGCNPSTPPPPQCRRRYPTILACLLEAVGRMDAALAAGTSELDVEHQVLVATNRLISRAFLELPDALIDPEV